MMEWSMTSLKLPNVYKKLPKNDFNRKIKDWHLCKNCLKYGWFGLNNGCHRLWKVAQSTINGHNAEMTEVVEPQ